MRPAGDQPSHPLGRKAHKQQTPKGRASSCGQPSRSVHERQDKKKKNFTFGGVEAFQSSLAPCKVDMAKKKDLYADDAE